MNVNIPIALPSEVLGSFAVVVGAGSSPVVVGASGSSVVVGTGASVVVGTGVSVVVGTGASVVVGTGASVVVGTGVSVVVGTGVLGRGGRSCRKNRNKVKRYVCLIFVIAYEFGLGTECNVVCCKSPVGFNLEFDCAGGVVAERTVRVTYHILNIALGVCENNVNNSFSGKINERCVVVTLGCAERNISEIFIFICEFNERNTIAEFYLKSKAADGGRCTDVYGNIVNTVNGIGNVNRESCILFHQPNS